MRVGFLVLGAVGCSGSGVGSDSDAPTDPNDTDPPTPAVETACDDTVDDDLDGAVDCADSDCAAVELCSWPTDLGFETRVDYVASFEATLGGYYDCTIVATSTLERDRAQTAPNADRVFCGGFTYTVDSCPSEFDRPTSGCFALSFASDTSWPIYFVNPQTSGWELLGNGTPDGQGWMRVSETTAVDVDGIDGGDITSTFRFQE